MTARKFDIFEVLGKIDRQDVEFYCTMSPEDRKTIPLFVVERWLSGHPSPFNVAYLNECVNPYMFSLGSKHPELLWMLMCGVGEGRPKRYKWLKLPGTKNVSSKPATDQLLACAYQYNTQQSADVVNILTFDDVCDLAEQMGYQQSEIDVLAKEWGEKVTKTRTKKGAKSKSDTSTDDKTVMDIMSAFEM